MSKRAQTALKKSIKRWYELYERDEANHPYYIMSTDECALCVLYYGCSNACPIKKKTGRDFCIASPYIGAHEAMYKWHKGTGTRTQWRRACKKMINFMEGLLE